LWRRKYKWTVVVLEEALVREDVDGGLWGVSKRFGEAVRGWESEKGNRIG
jgi:hypothetical protein